LDTNEGSNLDFFSKLKLELKINIFTLFMYKEIIVIKDNLEEISIEIKKVLLL
jgi:hypothetical protein